MPILSLPHKVKGVESAGRTAPKGRGEATSGTAAKALPDNDIRGGEWRKPVPIFRNVRRADRRGTERPVVFERYDPVSLEFQPDTRVFMRLYFDPLQINRFPRLDDIGAVVQHQITLAGADDQNGMADAVWRAGGGDAQRA